MSSNSSLTLAQLLTPLLEQSVVVVDLRFDLEFDTVLYWLFWVVETSLINVPALVFTIVANPPVDVTSVSV